jgi:hypothetical protein
MNCDFIFIKKDLMKLSSLLNNPSKPLDENKKNYFEIFKESLNFIYHHESNMNLLSLKQFDNF